MLLPGERLWCDTTAPEPQQVAELAAAYNLHPVVARLAAQRLYALGLDAGEFDTFFAPTLQRLPDPDTLPGIRDAVPALLAALRARTKIGVFGDYDVDGISGTALLVRFLRAVGAEVIAMVPNRSDGYGLMPASVATLARRGVRLIVTVDNGIAAHPAAEAAAAAGIELIITDHHHLSPQGLPPARAHVHPGVGPPGPWLGASGAGVAFALVVALRRALRELGWFANVPEPTLTDALQLATLGTIADVVPLVGVNRILVANGLARLPHSEVPGIAALAAVARAPSAHWDTDVVAFYLGPRLNAAGRIGDAGRALNLLLSDDTAVVQRLAQELDRDNRIRRQQEKYILDAPEFADKAALASRALIFAARPGWNHGVLGIVAGRLAQCLHRPTLLFAIDGDLAKGSGRSIPEVDLMAALETVRDLAVSMGGHREAAGLTLPTAALAEARRRVQAYLQAQGGPGSWTPRLMLDAQIQFSDIGLDLVRDLDRLGPFGAGNARPLFRSEALVPLRPRRLQDTNIGFDVPTGRGLVSAVGFCKAELFDLLKGRIEFAFRPTRNIYRGRETVQLVVEDIRPALL